MWTQKRLLCTNGFSLFHWQMEVYFLGFVLIDLSKPFETINYEFLVEKLNAYGFSKEKI